MFSILFKVYDRQGLLKLASLPSMVIQILGCAVAGTATVILKEVD